MIAGKKIFGAICLLLIAMFTHTSCQQEEIFNNGNSNVSGNGVSLTFSSDPMQQYNVKTRSSDPKEDEEKTIKQLYIFFFNSKGEWLTGSYLEGYKDASGAIEQGGYIAPGQGSTIIKIANDSEHFGSSFSDAINAQIYAVANVETSLFKEQDENDRPKVLQDIIDGSNNTITNPRDALKSIIYKPETFFLTEIPPTGMPMISEPTVVDLTGTTGQTQGERIIQMKALMARIDFSIRLESDVEENSLPSMLLTKWKIKNLPIQVSFSETNELTGTTFLTDATKTSYEISSTQMIYNKEGEIELSFYMFENVQQAEWKQDDGEIWISDPNGVENEDALYPAGIKEYEKQHYKPYLANENATAVEFTSQYTTYNNATYNVVYTLYLGNNHTNNFAVVRNRQYKNNIVIKGLTQVGSNPEHITFDARVNVTEQNNKFYISILREQNHDAHFCVTPMDIYFFNADPEKKPTMKISFKNETVDNIVYSDIDEKTGNTPWIRMEVVDSVIMRTGKGFDENIYSGFPSEIYGEWHAGNGKRKYFTTNLVTETLNDDSGKNVTIDNSRDRVYLYIDENLLEKDRYAKLFMEYYENDELVSSRELIIKQLHFLKVQVYDRDGDESDYERPYNNDDSYSSSSEDGVIYMEQIEEYLEHYDPLDKFNSEQLYEWLPWGLMGESVSSYKNWLSGLYYTGEIVEDAGQTLMTLNETPESAAEYCYNRNKRSDNGNVYHQWVSTGLFSGYYETNRKYFLPGIRQMEDALTQYYTVFNEFQDNYYWSSAAGENKISLGWNEYARATKVVGNVYVSSSPGDSYPDKGGYAKRDAEGIRIRAFRSDLEPLKYK